MIFSEKENAIQGRESLAAPSGVRLATVPMVGQDQVIQFYGVLLYFV